MDEAKDSVTSVHVSDHEILSGSADCQLRQYDLRSGLLHTDFIGSTVTCVSLTGDGQCVLVSTLANRLYLIDKTTGELLNEYVGHVNSEFRIDSVISSSDRHILSGSEDGCVYVWHLIDGKQLCKLQHQQGGHNVVNSLSFHPTQSTFISACQSQLYLWKLTET